MDKLSESLPTGLLRRIEKELGREAMLQHLWPAVVGGKLAETTRLKSIQSRCLIIAVPDRSWIGSLGSLKGTILTSVNRLLGDEPAEDVELVQEPQLFPPAKRIGATTAREAGEPLEQVLESAAAITDESVRKTFESSARKYFAIRKD